MALQHWMTYHGTDIFRVDASAYTYTTRNIALDADGSPRAYNPGDTGLDANANAGYPHGGWRSVLLADPNDHSRPYVQPAGANQGFFVSMTTLHDPNSSVPDTYPAKYVYAETFPYIVFPGGFFAIQGTGGWGDVVLARSLTTGRQSAALVGDEGGTNEPLGEISLSLAVRLGGHNPNPRTGAGSPPGPSNTWFSRGRTAIRAGPARCRTWSSRPHRCCRRSAAGPTSSRRSAATVIAVK